MLWKMWCFIWQSMGRPNHKFNGTWNVQNVPEIKCISVGVQYDWFELADVICQ